MLEVSECLDIAAVERLRKQLLGQGLDEKDSYSYHLIMTEDGRPVGAVRLYADDSARDTLVIDRIAISDAYGLGYREMLVRSMLLRAIGFHRKNIEIHDPVYDFYSEMGFSADGTVYRATCDQIQFTCKCHHQPNKEERS